MWSVLVNLEGEGRNLWWYKKIKKKRYLNCVLGFFINHMCLKWQHLDHLQKIDPYFMTFSIEIIFSLIIKLIEQNVGYRSQDNSL